MNRRGPKQTQKTKQTTLKSLFKVVAKVNTTNPEEENKAPEKEADIALNPELQPQLIKEP